LPSDSRVLIFTSTATSELASFVIWLNPLDITEADQYHYEQALFLDPCDTGIHLELEH